MARFDVLSRLISGIVSGIVGNRKCTVLGTVLLATVAWGSEPEYFPLDVGNLWVYQTGGTRCCAPVIVEVVARADFNGRTYFRLRGFPRAEGDFWVRINDTGSLVAYDPDQNQESVWYAFQATENQPFETAVPFALGLAAVLSRNTNYQGPAGGFDNALRMGYPRVFQVGISEEVFVPDVGLVRRTESTGGPSAGSYELVYARVGEVTIRSDEIKSGITGHIVLGPTCPVSRPDDPTCADKPYETEMVVRTEDGSWEVSRFHSNSRGYFRVALANGAYRLEAAKPTRFSFPFFRPVSVKVESNTFTIVTLMFDTGIR